MVISRALRAGLALVVVAACAAGGAIEPVRMVACGMVGYEIDCGDPEFEAELKAGWLTPEQARAAGCPMAPEEEPEPDIPYPSDEPTVAPRAIDPAVTARVNAAWDTIERWLAAHASATLRALAHPASAEDVARSERNMETTFPDALYASLLRHNGADGNLGSGFQLPKGLGLAGMSSYWSLREYNCRDLVMAGSAEDADPDDGTWHGSLLPFSSSGRGEELFIDPRTGRVGEKGNAERLRYDGPMSWPSYLDLLEAVAAALGSGRALREWYPVVTSGCELRWAGEPAPAPTANCAGGPRPSPTPEPTPTPYVPTEAEVRATGCKPDKARPVVRRPSPAVAARVDAAWRRIERWLARKAPADHRGLGRPARPAEIARAEAAMGLRFPDDLRASLLRHDGGSVDLSPFYSLTPVKGVLNEWKLLCEIVLDTEPYTGSWWDGHLIPFAENGMGDNLFADSATGAVGEFFHEEGLRRGDWPSYLALLQATARALETGEPIDGWRRTVSGGRVEWKPVR
ncbi:hypothetical protein HII36_39380 [Nonomuraea sp. NN258]|uniref:SMI1/KNR4 family protein n=1 Tax=Nonomuraea antri TaxID=2730852 RepID=UPI0015685E54|nr:SMI1/KNR4 family protein [Nonomuraea antri]NRQ37850.1 hypothetical protein [Nonomuraea antri]